MQRWIYTNECTHSHIHTLYLNTDTNSVLRIEKEYWLIVPKRNIKNLITALEKVDILAFFLQQYILESQDKE